MKIEGFIDYVKSFYYGDESIYQYNWTESQIIEGCYVRFNMPELFCNDSVDREWVRDYLIDKYGE